MRPKNATAGHVAPFVRVVAVGVIRLPAKALNVTGTVEQGPKELGRELDWGVTEIERLSKL